MIQRKAEKYLLQWKRKDGRKPLIIRGARQVGKSTIVDQFAKAYRFFVKLNLEREEDKDLFSRFSNVTDLYNALLLREGIDKEPENTLLFIDEIQEYPPAVSLLRYFFEDLPQLHVISAGSLLEFAMTEIDSFPVGRVEQMNLYPIDFEEFLMAQGKGQLVKELNNIPLNAYASAILLKEFHQYVLIGGMPEVVQDYVTNKDLTRLAPIYENLWYSYKNDIEKYAQTSTERNVLRHIMDTAIYEKDRISFAGFGNSNYKSKEVGEAFRSLQKARIMTLIYPTTSTDLPALPDLKRKPRIQFLDVGILNYALNIQSDLIGISELNDFHRGKIIMQLMVQEYIAQKDSLLYKPMFWVRENTNSNAEVDFVISSGNKLIPVEVKSGKSGRLRSLHQFIERSEHPYAIRLLANDLNIEEAVTPSGKPYRLLNLPYFLASKLDDYARWFLSQN